MTNQQILDKFTVDILQEGENIAIALMLSLHGHQLANGSNGDYADFMAQNTKIKQVITILNIAPTVLKMAYCYIKHNEQSIMSSYNFTDFEIDVILSAILDCLDIE